MRLGLDSVVHEHEFKGLDIAPVEQAVEPGVGREAPVASGFQAPGVLADEGGDVAAGDAQHLGGLGQGPAWIDGQGDLAAVLAAQAAGLVRQAGLLVGDSPGGWGGWRRLRRARY